jgi:general stress protein 26
MTTITIESETTSESKDYIKNFLNDHYSGVLATSDAAANPHVAVVYHELEDDFGLLFATKKETQKYKNIAENKQVAYLVYDEQEQTTLQVFGFVEEIDNKDKADHVIKNMYRASAELSQTEIPPADKLIAGDFVALRLIPQTIKMAVYARPTSEGDDLYEQLNFHHS